jgi:hypothetical protein
MMEEILMKQPPVGEVDEAHNLLLLLIGTDICTWQYSSHSQEAFI